MKGALGQGRGQNSVSLVAAANWVVPLRQVAKVLLATSVHRQAEALA